MITVERRCWLQSGRRRRQYHQQHGMSRPRGSAAGRPPWRHACEAADDPPLGAPDPTTPTSTFVRRLRSLRVVRQTAAVGTERQYSRRPSPPWTGAAPTPPTVPPYRRPACAYVAHNRLRSPETKKRHRPLSATSRGYGRPRRRRNWSRSGGVHQPYPLIETAHDKTAAA